MKGGARAEGWVIGKGREGRGGSRGDARAEGMVRKRRRERVEEETHVLRAE